MLGDAKAALGWVRKERDNHVCLSGRDHPETEESARIIELLEAAVEKGAPIDGEVVRWCGVG